MLNPSTADEITNDPTVAKCQGWARTWGFGGIEVLNLFAFRATDPEVMKKSQDPIGPENDFHIVKTIQDAGTNKRIVCAWGNRGSFLGRNLTILDILRHNLRLHLNCLGLTKNGHPKHPLYLAKATIYELF